MTDGRALHPTPSGGGGVWLDTDAVNERRAACAGPLAPLADSLAADLEPLLDTELVIPTIKARLSRAGGWCPRDGSMLAFDPLSPWRHGCAVCGEVYDGEAHHRWWVMGFHLWIAERAVHAAALHALRGDPRHARFAADVLARYADLYLGYPNSDNVLGPSRPLFSTYLESLWLLHICTALDMLESFTPPDVLGSRVRERLVAPSAKLIAGFHEGGSNRQVWNNAALLAAGICLDDRDIISRAAWGASGVHEQLSTGLLADGSWFEGENYHQFAHRGLWYCLRLMDAAGEGPLPANLIARFDAGFRAPFLTALPDMTAPSRRDSRYAVSLRQWRFAEMAELGLARRPDDPTLLAALHRLYDGQAPSGDTGRWRATGEAERNEAPVALDRSSLGWKSLIFARPSLPPLAGRAPRSVLQPAQGLAVFRRHAGTAHVTLDYGHGGGGHGHPDRLNLTYMDEGRRWLDDPGTGSYVDRSLHWYRSTLAHCAPMVDGRSQRPTSGRLVAWDERGVVGLVEAVVEGAAPGVTLRRTVVVMDDYFVDELRWSADRDVRVELPLQVDASLDGVAVWTPATAGVEGEEYLAEVETAAGLDDDELSIPVIWTLTPSDPLPDTPVAWVVGSAPLKWWRAIAPGPPGRPLGRLHVARMHGTEGWLRVVWSARSSVSSVRLDGDMLHVRMRDGTRQGHVRRDGLWHVDLEGGGARSSLDLGGIHPGAQAPGACSGHDTTHAADDDTSSREHDASSPVMLRAPFHARLGEAHYRRSEPSWQEAGAPTATVTISVESGELVVSVSVTSGRPSFTPPGAVNEMDNERPEINHDSVQLHLLLPALAGSSGQASEAGWLLAPGLDGSLAVIPLSGSATAIPMRADWERTADGYRVVAHLPVRMLGHATGGTIPVGVDVLVNETGPGRERRRGQLVLSGGAGEFVYLRGDRHDPARCLTFLIPDA